MFGRVVGFFSDPVGLVVQRIELPIIGRVVEGSKNAFCVIEQSSSCGNCGCPKVVGVPWGRSFKGPGCVRCIDPFLRLLLGIFRVLFRGIKNPCGQIVKGGLSSYEEYQLVLLANQPLHRDRASPGG